MVRRNPRTWFSTSRAQHTTETHGITLSAVHKRINHEWSVHCAYSDHEYIQFSVKPDLRRPKSQRASSDGNWVKIAKIGHNTHCNSTKRSKKSHQQTQKSKQPSSTKLSLKQRATHWEKRRRAPILARGGEEHWIDEQSNGEQFEAHIEIEALQTRSIRDCKKKVKESKQRVQLLLDTFTSPPEPDDNLTQVKQSSLLRIRWDRSKPTGTTHPLSQPKPSWNISTSQSNSPPKTKEGFEHPKELETNCNLILHWQASGEDHRISTPIILGGESPLLYQCGFLIDRSTTDAYKLVHPRSKLAIRSQLTLQKLMIVSGTMVWCTNLTDSLDWERSCAGLKTSSRQDESEWLKEQILALGR